MFVDCRLSRAPAGSIAPVASFRSNRTGGFFLARPTEVDPIVGQLGALNLRVACFKKSEADNHPVRRKHIRMNHHIQLFLGILFAMLTQPGYAETIISYEFTGTRSPTQIHSEVSASDFSSPVFRFSTGTNTLQTADGLGLADGGEDDMNGAIAAQQYSTFAVTADPGYRLTLSSLAFDVGRGLRGAQDYAVRSSADSFASNIVFANQAISQTVARQDVSLSGSEYDGLSAVEFRIYFDDRLNNSASASETFLDNVTLNGTVTAVPEPTLFTMLAGGLSLWLVALRARRSPRAGAC